MQIMPEKSRVPNETRLIFSFSTTIVLIAICVRTFQLAVFVKQIFCTLLFTCHFKKMQFIKLHFLVLLSPIYRRNMLTPKHKPYLPCPQKKTHPGQQHQASFSLTPGGFPIKTRLSVELVRKQLSPTHYGHNSNQKLPLRIISHTHLQYSHQNNYSKPNSPTKDQPKILLHSLSCKNLERRQAQSAPTSQENIEAFKKQTMNTTNGSFGKLAKKISENSNLSKQNIKSHLKQSTGYKFFKRQASNNILLQEKANKGVLTPNGLMTKGLAFNKNTTVKFQTEQQNIHTSQLRKCLPSFMALRQEIPAPLLSKTQSNNEPNTEKWAHQHTSRNSCKEFLNRSILASDKEVAKFNHQFAPLSLDQFVIGNFKGQGRYGKVYHAIHKKTGWNLAIKKIKKDTIRSIAPQFLNQLKIQYTLNHPNIIKLYGYFDDKEYIYLLLEYMEEGSLYRYIKKYQKMEQEQAIAKLGDVCQAVAYLHRNDILHRDIKPQNVVISHGVCKLCDFGWSVCSKAKRKTCCGTIDYTCPQVASGASYNKQIDIWALGVLAFEMLTGKPPFYHFSRQQTMTFIRNCDFQIPNYLSQNARNFILKILNKDSSEKVRIEDLLIDVFFQNIDKSYIL